MKPALVEITAAVIFALAILHTFSTKYFERLARAQPAHAGLWHLLGEVEVVFGFWAMVLVLFLVAHGGLPHAVQYLDKLNFTEAMFVFAIMVIAGSRPILGLAQGTVRAISAALPLPGTMAFYFVALSAIPLLGSFITEPAAMTLAALLLRDHFYRHPLSTRLRYATVGVLFVNISIGGTLTPFAAPPVLMVAGRWGWDIWFMLSQFGWKAALAVGVNAVAVTLLFRSELRRLPAIRIASGRGAVPLSVTLISLAFLVGVVAFVHHPSVFMGLFLFYLGFAHAYRGHQDRLLLREGLMVGFFLAGLVCLGNQQQWWLQDVLAGMDATTVYIGAMLLTAITDNAALTYLGSLVEGVSEPFKYALVAGAVTGGGLTVIANAPNPAGFSILKDSFEDQAISPFWLLLAAIPPTLVAAVAFNL